MILVVKEGMGVYNGMGLGVRFKWLGVSSGWRGRGVKPIRRHGAQGEPMLDYLRQWDDGCVCVWQVGVIRGTTNTAE